MRKVKKTPVSILIGPPNDGHLTQPTTRAFADYPPMLSEPTGFTTDSIKQGGIQGYGDMQRSLGMRDVAWPRTYGTACDQTETSKIYIITAF